MSQELLKKLAKTAHGYTYEEVLNAAACMMLTVLRQKHIKLAAAAEEADDICRRTKCILRDEHYNKNGTRKGVVSLDPAMFPELAASRPN